MPRRSSPAGFDQRWGHCLGRRAVKAAGSSPGETVAGRTRNLIGRVKDMNDRARRRGSLPRENPPSALAQFAFPASERIAAVPDLPFVGLWTIIIRAFRKVPHGTQFTPLKHMTRCVAVEVALEENLKAFVGHGNDEPPIAADELAQDGIGLIPVKVLQHLAAQDRVVFGDDLRIQRPEIGGYMAYCRRGELAREQIQGFDHVTGVHQARRDEPEMGAYLQYGTTVVVAPDEIELLPLLDDALVGIVAMPFRPSRQIVEHGSHSSASRTLKCRPARLRCHRSSASAGLSGCCRGASGRARAFNDQIGPALVAHAAPITAAVLARACRSPPTDRAWRPRGAARGRW